MATLYARPNLTTMSDPSGWSYTSGGPAAGIDPTNSALIFDSESGNPRLITGALVALSMSMAESQSMSFSGEIRLSASSVLKGNFYSVMIDNSSSTAVRELDVSQAIFAIFKVTYCYCRIYKGALIATQELSVAGRSYKSAGLTIDSTDRRIVAGVVFASQEVSTGAYSYIRAEGGVIELTGTTGTFNHVAYLDGALILGLTGTLKITNKTAEVKTINSPSARNPENWGNFVNDTGPEGGVSWVAGSNQSFASYNAGMGCKNTFAATYTFTANNWIIDGAGSETHLTGSATTRATLAMPNNGQITANNARFRYIALNNGRAVNSTDAGGNLGISFVKIFSRFFSFF